MIVNFKAYEEATGENAEKLAKAISQYCIVAVQNADLHRISRITSNVFAQHIDTVGYGAFTGHDSAFCLKQNGAKGVIINHSEDPSKDIGRCVSMAKQAGLKTVVCVGNPEMITRVLNFKPDHIAYEPPELIGSGISVTTRPNAIKKAVELVGDASLLCGAGITKPEDVKEAIKLGCKGILVASGVVKSDNPAGLIRAFRQAALNL